MMESFTVQTQRRNEFVEITGQVRKIVQARKLKHGVAVVYCPHTTAALTINENADPDVVHDILLWFDRVVPKQQTGFRHGEGNSDSHIKASLVGPSVTALVEDGELVFGTWQGIYFCEFDGPRARTVMVRVLDGAA